MGMQDSWAHSIGADRSSTSSRGQTVKLPIKRQSWLAPWALGRTPPRMPSWVWALELLLAWCQVRVEREQMKLRLAACIFQ